MKWLNDNRIIVIQWPSQSSNLCKNITMKNDKLPGSARKKLVSSYGKHLEALK